MVCEKENQPRKWHPSNNNKPTPHTSQHKAHPQHHRDLFHKPPAAAAAVHSSPAAAHIPAGPLRSIPVEEARRRSILGSRRGPSRIVVGCSFGRRTFGAAGIGSLGGSSVGLGVGIGEDCICRPLFWLVGRMWMGLDGAGRFGRCEVDLRSGGDIACDNLLG